MTRRFDMGAVRPSGEKTHEQDGPRPERSDHSNLGPQERTPHPTVRRKRQPASRKPAA
jgi:hypothetical protein